MTPVSESRWNTPAGGAHQHDVGDDGPREVEREHAQEHEQVGERGGARALQRHQRQEHERRGREQRGAADERVAVGRAPPQPLRQRRARRHAQRARRHARQPELVRHACAQV